MNKWLAFWLLGLIWGSSFLLIRVGVHEMTPFQVVFIRTVIAAVGMNIVLALQGKFLPWRDLRRLLPLIVIGIGNTSLPFFLISWGEQSIPSSLAGILQSTAVFFTMIAAHLAFHDERITPQKLVGLVIGFVGVALLATRDTGGEGMSPALLGALAVVAASLCYGVFTVYSKQQIRDRYEPLMVSAGAMTFAAISSGIAMIASPLLGGQPNTPLAEVSFDALAAVITLGVLNTFIAYLMYYNIVVSLGAARSSMVTYIVPAVSVLLGTVILNEVIDGRLLFGTALIFMGIAVVNLGAFAWLNGRRRAAAA